MWWDSWQGDSSMCTQSRYLSMGQPSEDKRTNWSSCYRYSYKRIRKDVKFFVLFVWYFPQWPVLSVTCDYCYTQPTAELQLWLYSNTYYLIQQKWRSISLGLLRGYDWQISHVKLILVTLHIKYPSSTQPKKTHKTAKTIIALHVKHLQVFEE